MIWGYPYFWKHPYLYLHKDPIKINGIHGSKEMYRWSHGSLMGNGDVMAYILYLFIYIYIYTYINIYPVSITGTGTNQTLRDVQY